MPDDRSRSLLNIVIVMENENFDWKHWNIVQKVTDKISHNDRQFFIILIAAMLVINIALIIVGQWGDVEHYWHTGVDVLNGKIPYEETADGAYPPLFIAMCVIPALFSTSYTGYSIVFTIMSCIFILISAYFSLKICEELKDEKRFVYFAFFLLLLCLPAFSTTRNDALALAFLVAAFYFILKKRYLATFTLLALGIMLKMIPALFVPAFLIPLIMDRKWTQFFFCIAWTLLICFIIELPILIITPDHAFDYLIQHTNRGIQIEALIAGPLMLLQLIFPDAMHYVNSQESGSIDIVGTVPDFIASILLPILFIILVTFFFYSLSLVWKKKFTENKKFTFIVLFGILCYLLFLAFNKVYSTQYNVWIFMLLAVWLFAFKMIGQDTEKLSVLITIFGIICLLDTVTYNYDGDPNIFFIIVTLIKAVALIYILAYTIRIFFRWLKNDDPSID